MLTAYFSWSGNVRKIAEMINKTVGGDIFKIDPLRPYSTKYNDRVNEAKSEKASNAGPRLKSGVKDMGKYNTIFLRYPNWWSSIPMPVAAFP
ncbi:MAG: hypothetical protein LBR53_03470 [Deltaproteobacteria bacterium]|jgi:flavodoxin|nr:hypothetical protein [Deltaproteobacteria bacterium]